ncbi:MAG TPA: glucose-6-phosphate isomerase [bacterium]|nr:glucose-6-phosphate isomerase [bacterium]
MENKTLHSIKYDYTNMLSDSVGNNHGITIKRLEKAIGKASSAFNAVNMKRKQGKLPFMDLPYSIEKNEIRKYASHASKEFDDFVVLGIGGSALGTIALQTALNPSFYNIAPKEIRKHPRIFVEDNVDPERISNLLETVNLKKTLFNVVTKSGGTAETMGAYLIVRELISKKLGASAVKKHIVATTDTSKGNLRVIADKEGLKSFIVPDGVGGRFSVLCSVGLLPAAMAGINIDRLLSGAAAMDKQLRNESAFKNMALMGALLQYLSDTEKGKHIQVMLPYSVALKDIADWFRQLWAESLGKRYSLDGKVVNAGQTPIKAVGATDQHSQLQLYNEGPNDKTITFLRVEKFRKTVKIPSIYKDIPGVSYLGGHEMGELLNTEQAATRIALTKNKRPNSTIILPKINPEVIGGLMYMLEVQTAYAGEMYGINTFDQPGVEDGKIATYALMGRPGFEKQKAEIEKTLKKGKKRII